MLTQVDSDFIKSIVNRAVRSKDAHDIEFLGLLVNALYNTASLYLHRDLSDAFDQTPSEITKLVKRTLTDDILRELGR